jgi:hypothetical protein
MRTTSLLSLGRWAVVTAAALAAGCDPASDAKDAKDAAAATTNAAATAASSSDAGGAGGAATRLPGPPPAASPDGSRQLFSEITAAAGFNENPAPYPDGTYMTPEITPGGVALFDYDNDGRLDVLVICHPPPMPYEKMIQATAPNRLFKQQADGRFVEVPGAAGLAGKGFHHGVAIGDVNNDGWQDVYVCNYGGPDEFFMNNGDGTFRDATASARLPTSASPANWSSTAAFFDYDADGHLDLWVAHFATFNPKQRCAVSSDPNELDYCGPHTFPGQLATLYRNNGDGTFADLTRKAGIAAPGRGWGLIAADLTGDGRPDVWQANDEEPNQLWVNQGDGTFLDEAAIRGAAFNAAGSVEANMGITIGDTRNAGQFDVYVTHITSETNTLWQNQGEGNFIDATATAGMAIVDRPFTGWGCGFFDYDNDGNLDLAVANGRVARGPARPEAAVGPFWNRYAEPNLLFRGDGTGKFADVSAKAGGLTRRLEVHRAMAFADFFDRGAVDVVIVNLDNTVRVIRNDATAAGGPGAGHHWLGVLPMTGKRDAIGAKVTVTAGGRQRVGMSLRAYSYLASNDPRVHFGLGKVDKVDAIEVQWPSGSPRKERFDVAGVDRHVTVRQGEGKPLADRD